MRIIPHLPRGAVVGLLAGSSLMLGGGLGAVAITSLQPAGALSAQVPAVGVREQNVNSAGRVRVALPASQIPSNAKLPLNSAGRVETSSPTPSRYTSVVFCGNGTGRSYGLLAPPPSGQTYHLGLVTFVNANSNGTTEFDLATATGLVASVTIGQNQPLANLPLGGVALGAGQGLNVNDNPNGCARVTLTYWVGPLAG